jgi:hypothetical protein
MSSICVPSLFHNVIFPDIMRVLEERTVLKSAVLMGMNNAFSFRCTIRNLKFALNLPVSENYVEVGLQ